MTVIAWDGRTLAADTMADVGGHRRKVHKLRSGPGWIGGSAGDADRCEELFAWFAAGARPETFPPAQRNDSGWGLLMIVRKATGNIERYERTPYPVVFPPQQMAIGSGKEFALATMHLGYDAVRAVQVACDLDTGCGLPIDSMTLDGAV